MSDPYEPVNPTYRDPVTPTWTDQGATTDRSTTDASATSGTADVAKEQAANVKDKSVDAGKQVAGTAKDEAKNVAGEAKTQAKDLFGQTKGQLTEQAGTQQKRVASGIRSLGDELSEMADKTENSGPATNLVKQAASRADGVASWLDDRDPGSLLGEVTDFARRRPGTFIAAAAVAGVLAGRLTRSIVSEAKDARETSDTSTATPNRTASYRADPPVNTTAGVAGGSTFAPETTDDFDSAGDYLGSGSTNPDPLEEPLIDEPPLSVGNEPYRAPSENPYRPDEQR